MPGQCRRDVAPGFFGNQNVHVHRFAREHRFFEMTKDRAVLHAAHPRDFRNRFASDWSLSSNNLARDSLQLFTGVETVCVQKYDVTYKGFCVVVLGMRAAWTSDGAGLIGQSVRFHIHTEGPPASFPNKLAVRFSNWLAGCIRMSSCL